MIRRGALLLLAGLFTLFFSFIPRTFLPLSEPPWTKILRAEHDEHDQQFTKSCAVLGPPPSSLPLQLSALLFSQTR